MLNIQQGHVHTKLPISSSHSFPRQVFVLCFCFSLCSYSSLYASWEQEKFLIPLFSREDTMEGRNDDTDRRCLVGDTTNKYHLLSTYYAPRSFPGSTVVKNTRANAGDARDAGSIPGLGRSPWSRKPTPVFLPGKCHGHRSLARYSPWGCKELDVTEQLSACACATKCICTHAHTHTHTRIHTLCSKLRVKDFVCLVLWNPHNDPKS